MTNNTSAMVADEAAAIRQAIRNALLRSESGLVSGDGSVPGVNLNILEAEIYSSVRFAMRNQGVDA